MSFVRISRTIGDVAMKEEGIVKLSGRKSDRIECRRSRDGRLMSIGADPDSDIVKICDLGLELQRGQSGVYSRNLQERETSRASMTYVAY